MLQKAFSQYEYLTVLYRVELQAVEPQRNLAIRVSSPGYRHFV